MATYQKSGASDVYDKIMAKTRLGLASLNKPGDPLLAIHSAANYLTEANIMFKGVKAPKNGSGEHYKYTLSGDAIAGLRGAVNFYGRALMQERADEAKTKAGYIRTDVQAEHQGARSVVQLRASKNPFKWVKVGRVSPSVVERRIGDAIYFIEDSKAYVKNVLDTLKASGFKEKQNDRYSGSVNRQLDSVRKYLEQQEKNHHQYMENRVGMREARALARGITSDAKREMLSRQLSGQGSSSNVDRFIEDEARRKLAMQEAGGQKTQHRVVSYAPRKKAKPKPTAAPAP